MSNGSPQGLFLLRSSAGAGKTHALVKHYLRACLAHPAPDAYRRILALTFTNKAASEMKDRVLAYVEGLANARTDDARINDVRASLLQSTGLTDAELAPRAASMHAHMLHHWPLVAISTIDAFTRRITKPFARDLQLDHDLEMTTEEGWYIQRAIDSLLSDAGHNADLTTVLSEACIQLLDDEQRWNVREPLEELAAELGKESSMAPLAVLRDRTAQEVLSAAARMRSQLQAQRHRIRQYGEEAMQLFERAGVTEHDLWNRSRGPIAWFRRLKEFEEDLSPLARTHRSALEENKLAGKEASAGARSAIDAMTPQLVHIAKGAEDCYRSFVLTDAILAKWMPTAALQALDAHLTKVKSEDGVAFFNDLTRKVAELVREEDASFVHERIGERYRHYLIDEFQDTSRMQWMSLLPLVENALSNGGSALLVGDAKQAIYRWRNGDVRQFIALPRLHGKASIADGARREEYLLHMAREADKLPFNRRSARAIVEFNNQLFDRLGTLLPDELKGVYKGQGQEVSSAAVGLVTVHAIPKRTQEDHEAGAKSDDHKAFLIDRLREALDDGYAPGDVCVLVTTGRDGRRVSRWLIESGYSVTSPDGLALSGDVAAELLVDLLRVVHQSDAAAALRALQALAQLHGTPDDDGAVALPFSPADPSPNEFLLIDEHWRGTLRSLTIHAQLCNLAHRFGLDARSDAHVLFLLDEAHTYSTAHDNGPAGFLEHWERTGRKRSVEVPASPNAVRVMTVHKAKGLEYPVVIVPFAERKKRSGRSSLWIAPGSLVAGASVALVADSKEVMGLDLPEVIAETEQRLLDNLDLLYVAFTRAEHRLHIAIDEGTKDVFLSAALLFAKERGMNEGELRIGERQPMRDRGHRSNGLSLEATPATDKGPSLALRFEAPDHWEPANPDPYRSRGNAIHAILAAVTNADELPTALHTAVEVGSVTQADAPGLQERLTGLLRRPDIAPWFATGSDIRSEATLIAADGQVLRPDRMIINGFEAAVLDIKTGAASDRHHAQVHRYMEVLRELGRTQVTGHLLYIDSGELVAVA